ncbi:MAG TPA: DUF2235 domain-containing protein [Candidatus Caenarcaniphilales bacterium]
MKRLVVCCDGTWQKLSNPYPTNVVKVAQAILPVARDKTPQVVYYDEGIGTGERLERLTGGAFGWGIDANIQNAYRFLCMNYSPDDQIYLFGFSRGAYTVRSLAGLINCSGIVSRSDIRDTPEAYDIYREKNDELRRKKSQAFRDSHLGQVPITLLGCWDTVGALGVPDQIPLLPIDKWLNKKYKFHNTILSPIIQHALHAVAIDEIRKVFDVTPMQKNPNFGKQVLHQVWFPGEHGCVGGGTLAERGLSDAALQWMMDKTSQLELGLDFDPFAVKDGIQVDHTLPFDNTPRGIYQFTGQVDREVVQLIVDPTTQKTQKTLAEFKDLHQSVKARWRDCQSYRPRNLAAYVTQLNAWKASEPMTGPSPTT